MTLIQTNISKSNELNSSYKDYNFKNIFTCLTFALRPKKVVEFGILEGYSLQAIIDGLINTSCQIEAYDLFDEFPYNAAVFEEVTKKFSHVSNVKIEKLDYYNGPTKFIDNSIDILHIDIANDGNVYEFAINNYMKKITENGIIILEGGSEDRDNYDWMIKYNRRKIQPFLKSIHSQYDVIILEDFPSMTIIKKNNNEKTR